MLDYSADGWYNGNIIKAQGMSQKEKANMHQIIIEGPTDECREICITSHYGKDDESVRYIFLDEDEAKLLAYALMAASQGSRETIRNGKRVKG